MKTAQEFRLNRTLSSWHRQPAISWWVFEGSDFQKVVRRKTYRRCSLLKCSFHASIIAYIWLEMAVTHPTLACVTCTVECVSGKNVTQWHTTDAWLLSIGPCHNLVSQTRTNVKKNSEKFHRGEKEQLTDYFSCSVGDYTTCGNDCLVQFAAPFRALDGAARTEKNDPSTHSLKLHLSAFNKKFNLAHFMR